MRKYLPSPLAFMIMLIVAIFAVFVVDAAGSIPGGVTSFIDEFGRACTIYEGSLDCDFDPCNLCEVQYAPTPNPTAPANTATPRPEPTSTPTPKETPEACNRGRGNGAEDCDPGNSGGNPGAAGEDNE